ncbi:hypothetical protein LY76DRAFT_52663 [Colletotrichum caudatum]|nr:hypothetical protein LY76DRAFT_52663 [Colletotrichum caudatum]
MGRAHIEQGWEATFLPTLFSRSWFGDTKEWCRLHYNPMAGASPGKEPKLKIGQRCVWNTPLVLVLLAPLNKILLKGCCAAGQQSTWCQQRSSGGLSYCHRHIFFELLRGDLGGELAISITVILVW